MPGVYSKQFYHRAENSLTPALVKEGRFGKNGCGSGAFG